MTDQQDDLHNTIQQENWTEKYWKSQPSNSKIGKLCCKQIQITATFKISNIDKNFAYYI